jgi:hypothetical protein
MWGHGLDVCLQIAAGGGYYERGNEKPSGSIKCGEFLD